MSYATVILFGSSLLGTLGYVHEDCPTPEVYSISIVDRAIGRGGGSLISGPNGSSGFPGNGSSIFDSNFNTAWFPGNGETVHEGLVVRVWDIVKHPEWTSAGAVAIVRADLGANPPSVENVTADAIAWPGVRAPLTTEAWGAADPRIVYNPSNKQYYLTWDNCTNMCAFRQTQLATASDPYDRASWIHHGSFLPQSTLQGQLGTAGAMMLFRPGKQDLAFVSAGAQGVNGHEAQLLIATSNDSTHWDIVPCIQNETNACCEDVPQGGTKRPGCISNTCCSEAPRCRGDLPTTRHCDSPKLGGMVGEGCSLELRCEGDGVIQGIEFADWGQPSAVGIDPLNSSACLFRKASNCSLDVKDVVVGMCVGRNSCTISTEILNGYHDPCSGHGKRLAVHATGCSSVAAAPPAPPPPGRSSLLSSRPQCWDNRKITAGPPPVQLSNGDYLIVYNTDNDHSTASWHGMLVGRCAMGWAVLDKDDPTRVLARSPTPLLVAELPFEVTGHTPVCVFADGLRPMGNNEFVVTYGAADTDVGAIRFKVNIKSFTDAFV